MKHFLKSLARLYPSAWRIRYGAEFEALLDESKPSVRDAFDVLMQALKMQATNGSFVKIVLPCAICGMFLAAIMSFARPAQYVSQTVIVFTSHYRAQDASSTAVLPDPVAASVRDFERPLADDALFNRLIEKLNLYPRERSRLPQHEVVDRMRRSVTLSPTAKKPGDNAYALEFSYPDAQVAQQVNTELLSSLMFLNLQALSEGGVIPSARRFGTIRVEHPASLPSKPAPPNWALFGVGGLIAGLAVGCMLVATARRNSGMGVTK